jgi:hypothetical protein
MSDTQNRIIDTPTDPYFSEVEVTEGADWADAEEADDDLRDAIGVSIGAANHAVYWQFWEGEDDDDDFASMRIQKTGTSTWADFFNSACDFASTPAEGSTVRLLCGIVKDA